MAHLFSRSSALCALVTTLAACGIRPALDQAPRSPDVGLLVMAHGGTTEWNAAVEEAVQPLRRTAPVRVAFGMADPQTLQHAVADLEREGSTRIAVVRLFVSGESFLHDTEYFFGVRTDPPETFAAMSLRQRSPRPRTGLAHRNRNVPPPLRKTAAVVVSDRGLADSPLMGDVLVERVTSQSVEPERETVLLVAHGMSGDDSNDRLVAKLDRLADAVRTRAAYRAVIVETLREDWGEKRAVAERRIRDRVQRGADSGGRVIVVPFRVSGFGPYHDVLEGLDYVADGLGLLPHRNVTTWIAEDAGRVLADAGWPNPFATVTSRP